MLSTANGITKYQPTPIVQTFRIALSLVGIKSVPNQRQKSF